MTQRRILTLEVWIGWPAPRRYVVTEIGPGPGCVTREFDDEAEARGYFDGRATEGGDAVTEHERYAETYERPDGKFGWRARDKHNKQITGVDGGQGFDSDNDAKEAVRREYPGIEIRESDEG